MDRAHSAGRGVERRGLVCGFDPFFTQCVGAALMSESNRDGCMFVRMWQGSLIA